MNITEIKFSREREIQRIARFVKVKGGKHTSGTRAILIQNVADGFLNEVKSRSGTMLTATTKLILSESESFYDEW